MNTRSSQLRSTVQVGRALSTNRQQARALRILLNQPAVLPGELARRLGTTTPIKVVIWRLRQDLGRSYKIKSRRHQGYWIDTADKRRIRSRLSDWIYERD